MTIDALRRHIEELRTKAVRAREHARALDDKIAHANLLRYAEELETRIAALHAELGAAELAQTPPSGAPPAGLDAAAALKPDPSEDPNKS